MARKSKRNAREHVCDTYSPTRACCWQAREAEFAALEGNKSMPDHPEHAAAVARALRGED